jgi:hypothetical protein
MRQLSMVLVAMLGSLAACSEHHGDAAAPPTAPTNLTATPLSGGAHLTWTDTSDNEEHFMIMRKTATTEYGDVDMVTFNTTTYHDSSVTAGTMYMYKVVAMNSKGEASSNEVMFTP